METKYEEIKTILEQELKTANSIKVDFGGTILRVQKAYGRSDFFVLAKGKKRYGNYLSDFIQRGNFSYIKVLKPSKIKTEDKKWLSQMNSIKTRLILSGLWPDLLKEVNIAIAVGYDNLKLASEAYWLSHKDLDYNQSNAKNAELVKAIDARLIREDGGVNTNIVWQFSHLQKIKKMRFSRFEKNEVYLNAIKDSLAKKIECHQFCQFGYDVSFEYNPETNKAFYSEEFRGCGNGHYYLALDATHALFYEDD